MIVFKYFLFLKRFSIKFCIWESNRFFFYSLGVTPKNCPKSKQGYESEKMTLKLEERKFQSNYNKNFSPSVSSKLGDSKNVMLTWPLTSWSLFTGLSFTLKSLFLAQKKFFLKNNFIRILWFMWDLGLVLFDSCKNVVLEKMSFFGNVLGFLEVNCVQNGPKPSFFDMSHFCLNA